MSKLLVLVLSFTALAIARAPAQDLPPYHEGIAKVEANAPPQPIKANDYTLTAIEHAGSAASATTTVTPEPVTASQPPCGGALDEEGLQQARARWNKQYEESSHAKFVQDYCSPLPQIRGDSVDWTCQEKVTYFLQGRKATLTPSITYHLKKKEGSWDVEGASFTLKKSG